MKPNMTQDELIEKVVTDFLEEDILESLLEKLDISPFECMKCLFSSGLIKSESLEEFLLSDLS